MVVPRSTWRGSRSNVSRLANSLVRLDKINQRRHSSHRAEQSFDEMQAEWSLQNERISQQLSIIDKQLSQLDIPCGSPAQLVVYQSEGIA